MSPEQIALCQRLAAEAARYRWARELTEDSRKEEAEESRREHRVGFLCDPKASRLWWAVWKPAYQAALDARATQCKMPIADAWGGEVHRHHAGTVACYARAVHVACLEYAGKAGGGPCWRMDVMVTHLARVEAWASGEDNVWIDVSGITPACVTPVSSLPWIVDPFGTMRHLAHLVASGASDQWRFHREQALQVAASTLASIEDPRLGQKYRGAVPTHVERLAKAVRS